MMLRSFLLLVIFIFITFIYFNFFITLLKYRNHTIFLFKKIMPDFYKFEFVQFLFTFDFRCLKDTKPINECKLMSGM